jgi:hypothetical protein
MWLISCPFEGSFAQLFQAREFNVVRLCKFWCRGGVGIPDGKRMPCFRRWPVRLGLLPRTSRVESPRLLLLEIRFGARPGWVKANERLRSRTLLSAIIVRAVRILSARPQYATGGQQLFRPFNAFDQPWCYGRVSSIIMSTMAGRNRTIGPILFSTALHRTPTI